MAFFRQHRHQAGLMDHLMRMDHFLRNLYYLFSSQKHVTMALKLDTMALKLERREHMATMVGDHNSERIF